MDLKIGFCGPSGTGKTTLAKYTAEQFDIPYHALSATMVLEQANLSEKDDEIRGKGHRFIINTSGEKPIWGVEFQREVLNSRRAIIDPLVSVVTDRTPIDNFVYMMAQSSHNSTDEEIAQFFEDCFASYQKFDHLFYVTLATGQPFIEDNGSRIPNKAYQEMINELFKLYFLKFEKRAKKELISHKPGEIKLPRLWMVDGWDWNQRTKFVKRALATSRV